MDKDTLVEFMGRPPDKIVPSGQGMRSKVWVCAHCLKRHVFQEPAPFPNDCVECGGHSFTKVQD